GVEEGLFPHKMSADDPDRLEEERRLCYVGITRAMEKLYISYAETRRLYGNETFNAVSRFVKEIPAKCIQEVRLKTAVTRPVSYQRNAGGRSEERRVGSGDKRMRRAIDSANRTAID